MSSYPSSFLARLKQAIQMKIRHLVLQWTPPDERSVNVTGSPTPPQQAGNNTTTTSTSSIAENRSTPFMGQSNGFLHAISSTVERPNSSNACDDARWHQQMHSMSQLGIGFVTFGSNLLIHAHACQHVRTFYLDKKVAGRNFAEVTFPNDYVFLHQIFDVIFHAEDANQQQAYLSLLPKEWHQPPHLYQVDYQMYSNQNQLECLVRFQLVTEKRTLEQQVNEHKHAVQMIATAARHPQEVLQALSRFRHFAFHVQSTLLHHHHDSLANIHQLCRQIHTFKGTLAQYHLIATPLYLHQLEQKINELDPGMQPFETFEPLLKPHEMLAAIDDDEQRLKETLGERFFQKELERDRGFTREQVQFVRDQLLQQCDPSSHAMIAETFARIRHLPFRKLIEPYLEYVSQLANELEKYVQPLQIQGGDDYVDPQRFEDFAQSLVHLFRNILDHGIEPLEERVLAGKNEFGKISCEIVKKEQWMKLRISDDGRGLDLRRVVEKAIELNVCTFEESQQFSEEQKIQLIFLDHFSTKDHSDLVSGRGMGMSAIKHQAEKIGGKIEVTTRKGLGTTFDFRLPLHQPLDASWIDEFTAFDERA